MDLCVKAGCLEFLIKVGLHRILVVVPLMKIIKDNTNLNTNILVNVENLTKAILELVTATKV